MRQAGGVVRTAENRPAWRLFLIEVYCGRIGYAHRYEVRVYLLLPSFDHGVAV